MVRHMLFIELTPQVRETRKEEAIRELHKSFSNMAGKIPGVLKAEVGANIAGGDFDACLYMEFEKPEDIPAYKEHPLHQELDAMAISWVSRFACVDYIIP